MYNDIVLDHFTNPRNTGSIPEANGIGRSGNPSDGDSFTIYIKVNDGIIKDIKFKTFGCGAAIAASSMLTLLASGKSLEAAMNISNADVAEALGGLPPRKLLCSNFAADALHAAIEDYSNNKEQYTNQNNLTDNVPEESPSENERLKDKNQIQRYLRHIIMPKISGAGQKKLINTSVLVYAASIKACDVLLYYMAASGISHIYCCFESKENLESPLAHIHDLNPEVNLEVINNRDNIKSPTDFNILIGDYKFISKIGNFLGNIEPVNFTPVFVYAAASWQGAFGLCKNTDAFHDFLFKLNRKQEINKNVSEENHFSLLGMSMSYAFMGTLSVIEVIKARINIGNTSNAIMCFDLLKSIFNDDLSQLSNETIFNGEIKYKLSRAKALIIGTGGLGCPAALALAKAGIGTIGLIDYDDVDLSNLNRQVLHSTSKIGMKKVESAKEALNKFNPEINVDIYPTAFSRDNAIDIINKYDIIIDGLDNIPTRYLLNDACFFAEKPLIEAGALAFYGQITTIIPGKGPCYRCIFKEHSMQNAAPSCSEVGVLGPVPGAMGILEAVEAIKRIIGMESDLESGLLMYDSLETDFNLIKINKDKDCALCGDHPSIHELGDYTFLCKDKAINQ